MIKAQYLAHAPTHLSLPPRLIVRGGNSSLSPVQFDSDLDDVPERGIVSEGSALYLELTADSSSIPLLLALRYEGEGRPVTPTPPHPHALKLPFHHLKRLFFPGNVS